MRCGVGCEEQRKRTSANGRNEKGSVIPPGEALRRAVEPHTRREARARGSRAGSDRAALSRLVKSVIFRLYSHALKIGESDRKSFPNTLLQKEFQKEASHAWLTPDAG